MTDDTARPAAGLAEIAEKVQDVVRDLGRSRDQYWRVQGDKLSTVPPALRALLAEQKAAAAIWPPVLGDDVRGPAERRLGNTGRGRELAEDAAVDRVVAAWVADGWPDADEMGPLALLAVRALADTHPTNQTGDQP